MYRLIRRTPLSTGQQYGDIIRNGDLSQTAIDTMLASGTLVRVTVPPLSEIPVFEERSDILIRAGIRTLGDLIDATSADLASKINKSVTTARRWQAEAIKCLEPPRPKNKRGG